MTDRPDTNAAEIDLSVRLGRLHLTNPILVASGTFGYAREMLPFVNLAELGGIVPKTVTAKPRAGPPTPRSVETAAGMLHALGLDNVSHGLDLGVDPDSIRTLVERVRGVCPHPIVAKLTPNVTDIVAPARAAYEGGADAVSLVNTFKGMAVNWRKRRPILANDIGGLSGPAIKPLALRMVWDVRRALPGLPIIGIGGISSLDDVLEFLVAGASAVQIGTATFADPGVSGRLPEELRKVLAAEGLGSVRELVGSLKSNKA